MRGDVSHWVAASPGLASAQFQEGATRHAVKPYFLDEIRRYVYAGDTALHIAAAAYRTEIPLRKRRPLLA
jgi:hypothetical protein